MRRTTRTPRCRRCCCRASDSSRRCVVAQPQPQSQLLPLRRASSEPEVHLRSWHHALLGLLLYLLPPDRSVQGESAPPTTPTPAGPFGQRREPARGSLQALRHTRGTERSFEDQGAAAVRTRCVRSLDLVLFMHRLHGLHGLGRIPVYY